MILGLERGKAETIRRLRLGELKRVFRSRYGYVLPDDDAGLDDLGLLLDAVSLAGSESRHRMKCMIEVWAPWMDTADAYKLVEAVLRKPDYLRKLSATDLGKRLNLTYDERTKLGIRTISPADLSPEEFNERRKTARRAKSRAQKQRSRRKAGVRSRAAYLAASITRLKPWAALGISPRTWYRTRTKLHETCSGTGMSTNKLLDRNETDLCQPECVASEGLPRKTTEEES